MMDFFKNNKKMIITVVVFFVVIIVLLFGGAFIYNKLNSKQTFSEVETNMKNAAIKYYEKASDELPTENNETTVVSDPELVNSELMKSVNKQLGADGYTCSGKVVVTNVNGNYRYNPILDCGNEYTTTKFIDYINNNVGTVESGNGLYNMNNELVFRGDNVNNYITISNKNYRIVKITEEHVVAIYTEKLESIKWDDRYNIDEDSKFGINDYSVSRIRDYLNELYEGNTLLSNKDKLLVTSYDVKIGKRNSKDTDKSGSLESSVILEDQYIGLLPVYDYLNASLDANCTSTTSESCLNYNYLAKYRYNWWTGTANNDNTSKVFIVSDRIATVHANSSAYVRPVLYLASDVIYVSGDGSQESPYVIK